MEKRPILIEINLRGDHIIGASYRCRQNQKISVSIAGYQNYILLEIFQIFLLQLRIKNYYIIIFLDNLLTLLDIQGWNPENIF